MLSTQWTLPLSAQQRALCSMTRSQTLHASTPLHHGAQYVVAACVAPRDTDTTTSPPQSHTKCSHPHWLGVLAPCLIAARTAGGLGPSLRIPLLADRNMNVAREYRCLIEDKWISFRAGYLINPKGVLRPITMNDLPVVRSVDEALRLVQAFQFTVGDL